MARKGSEIEQAWRCSNNILSPFLTPEEDRELVHEYLKEPRLYQEQYHCVPSKLDGKVIPFKFKLGQEYVYKASQMMREQKRPVRIIDEKNRRCGFSSWVASYMSTFVRFTPGFPMRVTSLSSASASEIMDMYFRYHDMLPEEIRPLVYRRKVDKLLEYGNNDPATRNKFPGLRSRITVGTAGPGALQVRGPGYRGLHNSEAAYYPDAEVLMQALLKTVPSTPETFIYIESTSNGMGGWFYDAFMEARSRIKTEDWEWFPLFLPSWLDEDCHPELTSEQDTFIQNSLDDYEFGMKKRFSTVDNSYLFWRRKEIAETCQGNIQIFNMESAPTLEEAFVAQGQSVFLPQAIEFYMKNTVQQGRRGNLVIPDHPGTRRPRPHFEPALDGRLEIWEWPEPGRRYAVGADASMGLRSAETQRDNDRDFEGSGGTDWCCAIVLSEDRRQVAQLRCGMTDPESFAEEVAALGWFYGGCRIMPEAGPGAGIGMIYRLKAIYPNIAKWEKIDSVDVRHEVQALGWEATYRGQPLSGPVLSPQGWTTMGRLRVGSYVHGLNDWIRVTQVFDLGERDVYRVHFQDHSSLDVTEDHLWRVHDRKRARDRVCSTREMMDEGLRDHRGWRWHIPLLPAPVKFRCRKLPIDPYTLGLLLGDGCFVNETPRIANMDEGLIRSMVLPAGVHIHPVPGKKRNDWPLSSSGKRGCPDPLTTALRDLGLWGHRTKGKFIPPVYMHSAAKDRLAILQGLMDTDGTAGSNSPTFCTTSPYLAQGIQELVWSLGGVATVSSWPPNVKYKRPSTTYIVGVNLPHSLSPFRLLRKKKIVEERRVRLAALPKAHRTTQLGRSIVSIEKIGRDICRCIQVTGEDGLYVAGNYIVTHNSKGILIGRMVRAVHHGAGLAVSRVNPKLDKMPKFTPRSKKLVQEMATFANTKDGGFGSRQGSHDDCVISCALGLLALQEFETSKVTSRTMGHRGLAKRGAVGFIPGQVNDEAVPAKRNTGKSWMDL